MTLKIDIIEVSWWNVNKSSKILYFLNIKQQNHFVVYQNGCEVTVKKKPSFRVIL